MKRSKVLKKIEDLIFKNVELRVGSTGDDVEKVAGLILDAVEKMGMKPPFTKERDLGCECGCKGWCAKGNNWDYEHKVNWKVLGGKEGRSY